MSEMIERVARAICAADGKDPDADWRVGKNGLMVDFADDQPQNWRSYLKQARAAVEALREPTEAMEKAGAAVWDEDLCTETNALNTWQAMNDEALR